MKAESFERKLTAILNADVAGYSRLMGDDEDLTIRTLTGHRKMMVALIDQRKGRVVDSPGDNLLAVFSSITQAVECAVEIQREMAERNAELPDDRKMEYRIGVNLGDVVDEGERIYGDGVNIAARLEAIADPGGICISGFVYNQVKNRLELEYEYLGEQRVKNIKEPVPVYRLHSYPGAAALSVIKAKKTAVKSWRNRIVIAVVIVVVAVGGLALWNYYFHGPSLERASIAKMAFPLPKKPSIAILPFVNISGDQSQDYISDGITEQIITYLSQNPNMFVIARNSVFTYKGKPVKTQKIAEELGVRYVLEGSVQTAGDRLRLTAQLIDALTGKHLWAERYDKDIKDIFALQDEITVKIFKELNVKLVFGERYRKYALPDNLDFLKKMNEGWSYFLHLTPESNEKARQLYEEAIFLEPENGLAYVMLGWTIWMSSRMGSKSPEKDKKQVVELAQKAIALNDSFGEPHVLLGIIHLENRQYEKAIEEAELALSLSPNNANVRAQTGNIYNYVGRRDESIRLLKQAIRLDPIPQSYYFGYLGEALTLAGNYEEAIKAFKHADHLSPTGSYSTPVRIAPYSLSRREAETKTIAEDILTNNPSFSIKGWVMQNRYKNPADSAMIADAMRKAGLPD